MFAIVLLCLFLTISGNSVAGHGTGDHNRHRHRQQHVEDKRADPRVPVCVTTTNKAGHSQRYCHPMAKDLCIAQGNGPTATESRPEIRQQRIERLYQRTLNWRDLQTDNLARANEGATRTQSYIDEKKAAGLDTWQAEAEKRAKEAGLLK